MPGAELLHGAAEALGEPRVGPRLPCGEGVGGEAVALVEGREELGLVHLRRRDREREPVAVPERACRLVPQPGQLPHVVGDRCADRLRRFPRLAALGHVVARAQDPLDLVVVDLAAPDHAAVLREPRLDGDLEVDDPVPERLRHLLRHERRVQEVELPPDEPVRAVRPGGLDLTEEAGVGQRVGQRTLGFHPAALVLVRRGRVRLPPGQRRGEMQGAKSVDGP